jgi:hydrogenase expression/formation protein HypE
MSEFPQLQCPVTDPGANASELVLLAHGEGGGLMRRLLSERILPRLGLTSPELLDDAAVLPSISGKPVLTADAFVVSPLFFPGGDIGKLAVYGTLNDLFVRGAQPLYLTLTMVLEEGLSLAVLDRVLESIGAATLECEVKIVAGDTKVVPRGAADRMFLSTTGLGCLVEPGPTGPATIETGDVLLVSGPIGKHGISIMAAREEMHFDPPPESDCASLGEAVAALRTAGIIPRAMRDATRGGVTAVLHEWARDCNRTFVVDETHVPVSPAVRGVCELLGLDPLSVANEGTMVVAVPEHQGEMALAALQSVPVGANAAVIGEVRNRGVIPVAVRRTTGREQPLIEPSGAPLPRIC